MTTTAPRQLPDVDTPARPRHAPRTVLGLSVPGLLAGAGASVTAAMLGSQLGVAGTLAGAAVSSLVAAIAGALYTAGLERTHHGLRIIVTRRPAASGAGVPGEGAGAPGEGAVDEAVAVATQTTPGRPRWAVAGWVVAALAMFALALVAITGIEAGAGRTLSGQPGTSVGRVTQPAPAHAAEPPVAPVAQAEPAASPAVPSASAAPVTAQPAPTASGAPSTPAQTPVTPAPTPSAAPSSTAATTAPATVPASPGVGH